MTQDRNEFRWRVYPRAVIATVVAAMVLISFTADPDEPLAEQYGGDLVLYYAAGNIVREGDGELLYDLDRQREAQEGYWESDSAQLLYVYPPVVAAVYAPLAALGYQGLYLVHSLVMVLALYLSTRLLASLVPWMANPVWRLAALAYAFAFLPLFIGSFVGQNTALLVLALSAVWWGLHHGQHLIAGVAAGLLVLKPQYGVPVVGLLFLARRWSAFGAAGVTTAVLGVLSILISGPGWLASWWDLVGSLSDVDQGVNLPNEVSILGLAEHVLGSGSSVAFAIWIVGVVVVVSAVLWRLWQRPWLDPAALALIPPMMLLIAPHSLYYDAGALLLSLAVLLPTAPDSKRPLLLVVWFLGGAAHLLHGPLGVQPVAFLVFATLAWAWWASSPEKGAIAPRQPAPIGP